MKKYILKKEVQTDYIYEVLAENKDEAYDAVKKMTLEEATRVEIINVELVYSHIDLGEEVESNTNQ